MKRIIAGVALASVAVPALREEILQEMFTAIRRALSGLRDASRIAPYVFRIAHHRGVSHVADRISP